MSLEADDNESMTYVYVIRCDFAFAARAVPF